MLWTVPNVLSAARLVGSPFLVAAAWAGWPELCLGLFVLLWLSDWLDGKIAVRWNLRTAFGAGGRAGGVPRAAVVSPRRGAERSGAVRSASRLNGVHFRLFGCRNGSHCPFSLLLATHCVMNSIPSTPLYTFG